MTTGGRRRGGRNFLCQCEHEVDHDPVPAGGVVRCQHCGQAWRFDGKVSMEKVAAGRLRGVKRVLTVCMDGNCRSVAVGWRLKHRGIAAVPVGWRFTTPEPMRMLAEWAERIIVVEPYMVEKVPVEFRSKVVQFPIGPDRWVDPKHPELWGIADRAIEAEL
jgi:hypothetical protein